MMMMMMMIIIIMSFVYPRQYFEALMLGRVSKFLKQIIQIKLNRVKNRPTGLRQTSWLFYKRGRGFELGTTENKSCKRSGRDLNSGPPNYKSSALTARPRCVTSQN